MKTTTSTVDVGPLLRIQFDRGVLVYNQDFTIEITGLLWPRELLAAQKIITIYKDEHKETTRRQEQPQNGGSRS